MSTLILLTLAIILMTFGVVIYLGRKIIISKLLERVYILLFIISASLKINDFTDIFINSFLFIILYAFFYERDKDKYIIYNVMEDKILHIVRDYLSFNRLESVQDDERICFPGISVGDIIIANNYPGTLINFKVINDKKIRNKLLKEIKTELEKIEGKAHSKEGIFYILLGLILMIVTL